MFTALFLFGSILIISCSKSSIFFAFIGSLATLFAITIITSIGDNNIFVKSFSKNIELKNNDKHTNNVPRNNKICFRLLSFFFEYTIFITSFLSLLKDIFINSQYLKFCLVKCSFSYIIISLSVIFITGKSFSLTDDKKFLILSLLESL